MTALQGLLGKNRHRIIWRYSAFWNSCLSSSVWFQLLFTWALISLSKSSNAHGDFVNLLAVRSDFSSLGVRDVALSKSLNTDSLSQLFIKGAAQELDCECYCKSWEDLMLSHISYSSLPVEFVCMKSCSNQLPHVLHLSAELTSPIMSDDLPMEARDMLIYKRG